MESKKETSYTYKVEDSAKRMDDILDTDDNDYKDKENSIPKRSDLTFKDGFYVNVTAVFIWAQTSNSGKNVQSFSVRVCCHYEFMGYVQGNKH